MLTTTRFTKSDTFYDNNDIMWTDFSNTFIFKFIYSFIYLFIHLFVYLFIYFKNKRTLKYSTRTYKNVLNHCVLVTKDKMAFTTEYFTFTEELGRNNNENLPPSLNYGVTLP